MALGDGDADALIVGRDGLFEFGDAGFDVGGEFEEFLPGLLGVALVAHALEDGVGALGALAHHVDGDVVEVFAGARQKIGRPEFAVAATIAPAD